MTEVWGLDLPHPQLLVALAMADVGDDDGSSIYPSLGRIGWKCGYSDRQVRRIVRDLEQAGLLVKVADPTEARGVEYQMVTAAGKPKAPFTPKKTRGGQSDRPDTPGPEGRTFGVEGADITVSADPSGNPPVEPGPSANASGPSEIERHPDAARLCRLLASLMRANDPKVKMPTNADRWVRDMRLLIGDRDGDLDEVEFVVRWCQADEFEQANVQCPAKLRKRFSQLLLKARTQSSNGQHLSSVDGLSPSARARNERQARRLQQLQTNPQEESHERIDGGNGGARALPPGDPQPAALHGAIA